MPLASDPISARIDTYLAALSALDARYRADLVALYATFQSDIVALVQPPARVEFDCDALFLDGTSDEIERDKRDAQRSAELQVQIDQLTKHNEIIRDLKSEPVSLGKLAQVIGKHHAR